MFKLHLPFLIIIKTKTSRSYHRSFHSLNPVSPVRFSLFLKSNQYCYVLLDEQRSSVEKSTPSNYLDIISIEIPPKSRNKFPSKIMANQKMLLGSGYLISNKTENQPASERPPLDYMAKSVPGFMLSTRISYQRPLSSSLHQGSDNRCVLCIRQTWWG